MTLERLHKDGRLDLDVSCNVINLHHKQHELRTSHIETVVGEAKLGIHHL